MRPPISPPPGVSATFGSNNGLLNGTPLSNESKVRGLTIIINFKDISTNITKEQVESMLNGDNYTFGGNYCSVKEYYKIMSSDKLEYTNQVVGPIQLRHSRAYYINRPCMKEALDIVLSDSEYNINLSQFDSLGRGVVDAVNFVYAGKTIYSGDLWPHNWSMNNRGGYSQNNIDIDLYTIQSLGLHPEDMKIGTFCHETGHLICRYPDLYDYGNRDGDSDPSSGLGSYCLMAAGSHLNNGRTPAPISVYLRDLSGWTTNARNLNNAGNFEASHGDYKTVHKYTIPNRPNEYFLVENRTRAGLDSFCKSTGLAVYHCDTYGSNEWQGGTADNHYQCGLIQADGSLDLENNRNGGDENDLFNRRTGVVLSHNTIPSSRAWGGMDSGLAISNISMPGTIIKFSIGEVGDIQTKEISIDNDKSDNWDEKITSTHRNGCYAQYYTFTINSASNIQIDLISSVDTYLYLLNGDDKDGSVIKENDDGGDDYNSRIEIFLNSGTYTIEATTYAPRRIGEFDLKLKNL